MVGNHAYYPPPYMPYAMPYQAGYPPAYAPYAPVYPDLQPLNGVPTDREAGPLPAER